jgi:RNA polymerase sigma factor (sigma-70 family)
VTDEELMLAVRDGDLGKLGVLFERYHAPLFDFLSRMTGNAAAAEDVVQDIFVRILRYRATFRDEGRFETWVFRIARNARADYFRSRPPVEPIEDEALETPATSAGPAHRLEQGRDVMRLKRALLMLRDDKRELIVLARYRDMKHEQIASLLGVDVGTVKVRLHRAVKELRDIFLRLSDEAASAPWNVKRSARTLPIT